MVDAVSTNVLYSGRKRYSARFDNLSDGTGETKVLKIDKSGLVGPAGVEPSKLVIEELTWSISGFTAIELYFDHDADDPVAKMAGSGYIDYRQVGGLVDPASTGGTGDLLLSTIGAAADATYDVTIVARLKA